MDRRAAPALAMAPRRSTRAERRRADVARMAGRRRGRSGRGCGLSPVKLGRPLDPAMSSTPSLTPRAGRRPGRDRVMVGDRNRRQADVRRRRHDLARRANAVGVRRVHVQVGPGGVLDWPGGRGMRRSCVTGRAHRGRFSRDQGGGSGRGRPEGRGQRKRTEEEDRGKRTEEEEEEAGSRGRQGKTVRSHGH